MLLGQSRPIVWVHPRLTNHRNTPWFGTAVAVANPIDKAKKPATTLVFQSPSPSQAEAKHIGLSATGRIALTGIAKSAGITIVAPVGSSEKIDGLLKKHAALAKRLKQLLELLKPQNFVRVRYQEEGSELDLDIAIRSLIDYKSGVTPDPRINMDHRLDGRNNDLLNDSNDWQIF